MRCTRREFLVTGSAALSALAIAPALPAAPARRGTLFNWTQLRPDLHAGAGQGGNVAVLQTDAGAVLIDAKNAPFGVTLRREADALGLAVVLLISTHHHADHTGGNHAFLGGDDPVRVIMHPKAKPRVEQQLDRYVAQIRRAPDQLASLEEDLSDKARAEILDTADRAGDLAATDFAPVVTLPDTMFDGGPIPLGGRELTLTHVGPGHTDNDIFIFMKEQNVLHAGDLVFNRLHPFMDVPGGATSKGWIASCNAMLEVCDSKTTVIPGHGEITDADGIRRQIRYFEVVREAAAKAVADGLERDRFVESDLPVFEDYGFTRIKERTLGTIYDEMVEQHKGGG